MSGEDRRKSSFSDTELFGNGVEENPAQLRRTISGEGKKKRAQFRSSKNDREFEVDSDKEADDVFEETDSNASVESGRRSERSKSDSVLPDVVISSSSTRSDGDLETSAEDSPDVVGRNFSQFSPSKDKEDSHGESVGDGEENRSILGSLTAVTIKTNPPKVRRSVSFQDDVKPRHDSKSNMDTESRRKEYRMSSGYGTGGSNTSLQSQQSAVSNLSQESEGNEPPQECGTDFTKAPVDIGRDPHSEGFMYEGDKNSVRIIPKGRALQPRPATTGRHFTGIVENGSLLPDDVGCIDDDDDETHDVQNLIPAVVTSLLKEPSIEESPGPLPNLSIMGTLSMEIEGPFVPGGGSNNLPSEGVDPGANCQTPSSNKACKSFEIKSPFIQDTGSKSSPCEGVDSDANCQSTATSKVPGEDSDDESHHDSSVMLPDFTLLEPKTPNIENVVSPSLFDQVNKEKLLEIIRHCCEPHKSPSQPPSVEFRIPDHVPPTPDLPLSRPTPSTGHSSCGMSHLLSAFLKNPQVFNFDIDDLQNLLKFYNGTPTSCHTIEEGSMVPDVSVPCVEIASRCKDKDCPLRKCQVMKAAMIGLQHTLDGFLDILSSPEVQNLCLSLFGHARNCEEPPMRCTVPWCYLLRGFGEEDDVSCFLVFSWIKKEFDTPACEEDVFPVEGVTKFIKLSAAHHHSEATKFGVTCPIELPGHYGNVMLVAETTPPLASIDAEVCSTDNLYVIKQVSNDESDFEMTSVFERLRNFEHPNLIHHFWIAEYQDHTNICLQYIPGDTLEAQLHRRMLFDPIMVLQMMSEILDAVDFLHSHGIIYLYWTLGNILLDGVHRRLILNNLTLSVTDDGKYDEGYTKQSLPPSLVPPEMLESELLEHNSDCWGAACVMVHLLSGHQIWYNMRHEPREKLWEQVKSGLCPFSSEEGIKIKQASLLALLKACFQLKLQQRIPFPELMRRVKATAADGNFDHLFDKDS